MHRRHLLAAALAAPAISLLPALPVGAQSAKPPMRTRWNVIGSEGYDAIAFLGPLCGRDLYRRYYAAEADAFAARLPADVRADIPRLADESDKSPFGLLWPKLANALSSAGVTTLDSVIVLLSDPDARIKPTYATNRNGSDEEWVWLRAQSARLLRVFAAMRDADFGAFRRQTIGAGFDDRLAEVSRALASYDVVHWQEKITGRAFDPVINVALLAFSKPHGAKMQDQTFLQAADYDTATTVRIAAHEMLHPPLPMDGPAATAALALLANDPLIPRIVADHDPKWGYTTLEGMLNEDMAQALDQLISEALGVARNPADRWRKADDGIHVLAGAIYGMLRQDRWTETGGSIEAWLAGAVRAGRFDPPQLHAIAAQVLERPVNALWPLG
jgi:hypothetical protein